LRFQKIKELAPRSYRRLLAKHSITPGPATVLAAKQQEQAKELPDQATAQDADEVLVLSDEEEEAITDDDEDIDIDLASAFEGISIKSKSSKMSSSEKTPTKNVMVSSNSVSSLGQSTTDTMPSSTEDHAASSDDSDPALDVLEFRCQWATHTCPIIILARPSHPERNIPFDVHSLEGMEHTRLQSQGVHYQDRHRLARQEGLKGFHPELKGVSKVGSIDRQGCYGERSVQKLLVERR
jgi:hypothetical protein